MIGLPDQTIVEVNFEGVSGTALIFDDLTRGKFNTGTFGGALAWVDVTAFVRSGQTMRGTSQRQAGPYARADAGNASVLLDNLDARFDPTNLSGPYVAAGITQVQPMRAWRVRAIHDAVSYDLWRGFADSWDLDYPQSGKDATVELRGTDGTKVLVNVDKAAQGSAGAGEDTGARITRILDNAEWPAEDRTIATGLTTVIGTTLAGAAQTEILLTADTEIGEVYIDGAGKVVFRNRHAILTEARSTTSQATFGDGGGELPYVALDLAHDDTVIANLIRINRDGGAEQTAEDATSQSTYLTRTFVRSDLTHQTDAESLQYAEYTLALLKDGDLRFDSITIAPGDDPTNLFPQVLGRQLGDRITVKWTPPGRPGDPIERDCHIRGIAHAWDTATWATTFYLADAGPIDEVAVVGEAIVGTSFVAF